MKTKRIFSAKMALLGLVGGCAHTAIMVLIVGALSSQQGLNRQAMFFVLAFLVVVLSRGLLQQGLVKNTSHLFAETRMKLVNMIFRVPYEEFERLRRRRHFETLNGMIETLDGTADVLTDWTIALVTLLGAFLYVFILASWPAVAMLSVVGITAVLYGLSRRSARRLSRRVQARQDHNRGLFAELIDGIKELSLHRQKRRLFLGGIENSVAEFYKSRNRRASKDNRGRLLAESMCILPLGLAAFAFWPLPGTISASTVAGFIIVLLFLDRSLNVVLDDTPAIIRLMATWKELRQYLGQVPAAIEAAEDPVPGQRQGANTIDTLKVNDLLYEYVGGPMDDKFMVGPIDLEAAAGEIVFLRGDNGSGKTTVAKLLTGLYVPRKGTIKIDESVIEPHQLGEYVAVFFNDYHLFDRGHEGSFKGREAEIQRYLKILGLNEKVILDGEGFDTLELFEIQRRRLTLLQCFLEDRPIYLFEEPERGQDRQFREFFFRDLIVRLKEKGKIVVVITRDDGYVDLADRTINLHRGKAQAAVPDDKMNRRNQ